MHSITFFIQTRVDRGVHTGIDVDGETVWERSTSGSGDHDPSLLWYIDVRCTGKRLPTGVDELREWFAASAESIKHGFFALAEKMTAGLDVAVRPYEWPIPGTPRGARIAIVCFSSGRTAARKMGRILRDVGARWEALVDRLEPVVSR